MEAVGKTARAAISTYGTRHNEHTGSDQTFRRRTTGSMRPLSTSIERVAVENREMEIRSHFDARSEDLIRIGVPQAATRRAQALFGGSKA